MFQGLASLLSYSTRTEPRKKPHANPNIMKRVPFGPTMIKTCTIGSKINQNNKMETPTIQREPASKKTRKRKNKFKIYRELRIASININRLKGKTASLESLLMTEKLDLALMTETKLKGRGKKQHERIEIDRKKTGKTKEAEELGYWSPIE